MNEVEYDGFLANAYAFLNRRIDASRTLFELGSFDRYDIDQDTGTITFSGGREESVVGDIQVVGTWAYKRNSWRWAWANSSILEPLTTASAATRDFGEEHELSELTEATWTAEEEDAWAMTAITAYLSQAEGAYRCPDAPSYIFVVYFNMRSVGSAASAASPSN